MSVRKYFGTDGIRGRTGKFPITADFAFKIGRATGLVLAQESRGKVLIGHDTRVSGYVLSAALEAGFTAAGFDVFFLGPMPTPGVAHLTKLLNATMGVVVSASHNPYYDNGMKFFSNEGRKLPDVVEAQIESYLDKDFDVTEPMETKALGQQNFLQDAPGRYIEFCKKTFSKQYDLKAIKIVVDCANGATSYIAPHVFTELGADVIAINNHPDGFNINEQCGSIAPKQLQAEVIKHQADIGIAFDGDGDRLILVDHKGELVNGDDILYILATNVEAYRKGVVGTLMSNYGLELAFLQQKIPFVRAKVGDRYVIDKLLDNNWALGGENSGHVICLDKTTTGDGIVAALQVFQILCQRNDTLHNLKQGIIKFPQVLKNIQVDKPQSIMNDVNIQATLSELQQLLRQKGRILVRPSGTEPLVRVMVEGEDPEFINMVADQMVSAVQKAASSTSAA